MDLKKIQFCNKFAYNICNNEYKKKILDNLKFKYNIEYNKPDTILYNKSLKKNITENPYLIYLSNNENNYILFLLKLNGINSCLLINRKIQDGYILPRILIVKFRFDNSLFEKDTIFEGELIKSENGWKFVFKDILVYKNIKLQNPYLKNLNLMKKILYNYYIFDPYIESCMLKITKVFIFDKKNYSSLLDFISNIDYDVNNIVFISPYRYDKKIIISPNNKEKITKLKIIKKRKVACFLMTKTMTPGIYQLYCIKNNNHYMHSIARISGIECNEFIQKNIREKKDKILVNCFYDKTFSKFVPLELSNKTKADTYQYIIKITGEKNII